MLHQRVYLMPPWPHVLPNSPWALPGRGMDAYNLENVEDVH